jgi:hypothetical protein
VPTGERREEGGKWEGEGGGGDGIGSEGGVGGCAWGEEGLGGETGVLHERRDVRYDVGKRVVGVG